MSATPSDAPEPLPPLPLLAARLRLLSKSVRSIGVRFGRNPERMLVEKDEIAVALDTLAAMLEGGAR